MNAILPLNVAAVRVSSNDARTVALGMKGRTVAFELMPYTGVKQASTGDKIYRPLEGGDGPIRSLGAGVHLHWELPDHFRRGAQPPDGGDIDFPPAPNRWLVVRYLSRWDGGKFVPVPPKAWVVESDYVSPTEAVDGVRPAISVPLPKGGKPYQFMGRVVEYASWNPQSQTAAPGDYLASYGAANDPARLTSIGYVGPTFAAYYPECRSVFGFWDNFADVPGFGAAIEQNANLQFRVSYQVIGWLADPADDPLADFDAQVRGEYQTLLDDYKAQGVPLDKSPVQVATALAERRYQWRLRPDALSSRTNAATGAIEALDLPSRTLCAGTLQEIFWNWDGTRADFLGSGAADPSVWSDTEVSLSIGNTTVEALGAMLANDLYPSDAEARKSLEYLLDAFQLGLLSDLEKGDGGAFELDEALHTRGFTRRAGGYVWLVAGKTDPTPNEDPQLDEVTLPPALAQALFALNAAQKAYDQGRAELDERRKQLFMDWTRYVRLQTLENTPAIVQTNDLSKFLGAGSMAGEVKSVVDAGARVGLIRYTQTAATGPDRTDPESPDFLNTPGQVTGMLQPAGTTSLAALLYKSYIDFQAALGAAANDPKGPKDWELRCAPAEPFWQPTEPVLLMQGDRMEPVLRNGADRLATVRVSGELLDKLGVEAGGKTFAVASGDLTSPVALKPDQPLAADVRRLLGEAALLTPTLADALGAALATKGAPNTLVPALRSAQGGASPLGPAAGPGLYEAVRTAGSLLNAKQGAFTFTNAEGRGWTPHAVAWNAQRTYPEFNAKRQDPFLPVFLVWRAKFQPLKRGADGKRYTADNLAGYFSLDADAIDYDYALAGGQASFAAPDTVEYAGSVALSKKAGYSLADGIERYVAAHPDDDSAADLAAAAQSYRKRRILSQSLSGFNSAQNLRATIPRVPVQNLVRSAADLVTRQVGNASRNVVDGDDWSRFGFNTRAPIATGLRAQYNFGPLRAGFVNVVSLEIVDVFGQRMQLNRKVLNDDATLRLTPSLPLRPTPDDAASHRVYLAPRVLAPTRTWFRWRSAPHGTSADFVEMNTQPASSPIFGWVLPNHLDNSLFFYDDDGSPVGSFGVEHNGRDLKYRTRAGNAANPGDALEPDLVSVNPRLANLMRFVTGKKAEFLLDLMDAVQRSDLFLNSPAFGQDAGVAVLIGRPLALARATLGLETAGGVLPLGQAETATDDPFPSDVAAMRTDYLARQAVSSAELDEVRFPVRLGDLAKANDGLVAFLVEGPNQAYDKVFAPASTKAGENGVSKPKPDTIQLRLNAPEATMTLLIDPRASVHVTTGVLPVAPLRIPPDQYTQAMRRLAVTFVTQPVLQSAKGLVLPLPAVAGHDWSWVELVGKAVASRDLPEQAGNDAAVYGYSPQTLREGWLRLQQTETTTP